jgi:hypothetical protein
MFHQSSYAMKGGQPATGDPLVVAIFSSGFFPNPKTPGVTQYFGCSGALMAPRVVFTAAHCLGRLRERVNGVTIESDIVSGLLSVNTPLWVSRPGAEVSSKERVEVIAQFASSKYQDSGCDNGDSSKCHGGRYDFGILILEEPLSNTYFSFATSSEISTLNTMGAEVLALGYGMSSEKGSDDYPSKSVGWIRKNYIWQGGDDLVEPKESNWIVQVKLPLHVYLGPGDSGSPIWYSRKGEWVYIGALSGATGPTSNLKPSDPLFTDSYWGDNGVAGPGGQYFSAQAFPDVIEAADKFLAKQVILEETIAAELRAKQEAEAKAAAELKARQDVEVAAAKAAAELKAKQEADAKAAATIKKITLTCVKGKFSKKVTAVKPKCPKGYKAKK